MYSHTFKPSWEEVIVMHSEKMKAKYMKEGVWKSFFRKLADWHRATSLQINFFTDSSQEFWESFKILTSSNGYLLFLFKMLQKHLWNSFLLYLVVEILQLVHETKVLYKRGVLKSFSKFSDKNKEQKSGGVLSKEVLKIFVKFTEKHLCRSLLFNKVAGWKL